jgi:hypothetical protein
MVTETSQERGNLNIDKDGIPDSVPSVKVNNSN